MVERILPDDKSRLRRIEVHPSPVGIGGLFDVTEGELPLTSEDVDRVWKLLNTPKAIPRKYRFSSSAGDRRERLKASDVMFAVCKDTVALGEHEKALSRFEKLSKHPDFEAPEGKKVIEAAMKDVRALMGEDDPDVDSTLTEDALEGERGRDEQALLDEMTPGGSDVLDEGTPGYRKTKEDE